MASSVNSGSNSSASNSGNSNSDSSNSASKSKSIVFTDASRVQTIDGAFKSAKRKRHSKKKRAGVTDAEAVEDNVEAGEGHEAGEPVGRSWVWGHFKKMKKPVYGMKNGKKVQVDEKERAQCRWCGTDLACNSRGNGTSTMIRHIDNVCKKYPGRVKLNDGQHKLSSTGRTKGTKVLVVVKWSQEGCKEAAVKMIVMDELPFSFIKKNGFRYFCRFAIPDWTVPSRRVIVKQFLKMYEAEKVKLRKELKGHCLCLTTDTWTSVQNINYMVVTAHFVHSNWQMQKRILSFKVIPNHQGSSIGQLLEDCLLEWGVVRVMTISVDNASANKVAIDYVRERMLDWEISPVLGGQLLHIKCFAHTLNLIVRSGLNMMGNSVASIRNAVRYVRSSGQRLAQFKQCMEKEKVECKKVCILDVPTRWNSTFLMLSTALELRKVFDRMAREDGQKYKGYFDEDEELDWDEDVLLGMQEVSLNEDASNGKKKQRADKKKRVGPPITHDWDKAETFVKFLKIFYDVTMRLSASTKPTSWKAFHDIVAIRAEIDGLFPKEGMSTGSEIEKTVVDMAVHMKRKYEKYFATLDDCNQLLLIALVLNPRYKLRNFESTCSKWLKMESYDIQNKSAELKELLLQLCDTYNSMNAMASKSKPSISRSGESTLSSQGNKSSSKKSQRAVEPTGIIKDMEEDWERELEDYEGAIVGHEVDRYLLDPIEKPPIPEKFDILEWWKLNGDKYPGLASLAKDVLPIQVSTVASESCFSTGRRVIDPFRSSLTPKTVEALICYQNWIVSESIQNIHFIPTVEDMEFYEEIEIEQAKEEAAIVDQPDVHSASKSSKASTAKASRKRSKMVEGSKN